MVESLVISTLVWSVLGRGLTPAAGNLSWYVTSYPGQLSLARTATTPLYQHQLPYGTASQTIDSRQLDLCGCGYIHLEQAANWCHCCKFSVNLTSTIKTFFIPAIRSWYNLLTVTSPNQWSLQWLSTLKIDWLINIDYWLIPLCVCTMSTSQWVVMLCGWAVKAGMAHVRWHVKLNCVVPYKTCQTWVFQRYVYNTTLYKSEQHTLLSTILVQTRNICEFSVVTDNTKWKRNESDSTI